MVRVKRYALFLRSRRAFAYDDHTRPQHAEFSVSVKSDKFELQLESAEMRFRERLLSLLPDAATNGSNLFDLAFYLLQKKSSGAAHDA